MERESDGEKDGEREGRDMAKGRKVELRTPRVEVMKCMFSDYCGSAHFYIHSCSF